MLRQTIHTNKTFNRYCERIRALDGRGLMVLIGKKMRLPDYLHQGNNAIGVLARDADNDAALDWLRLEFCRRYKMHLNFAYAAFEYARQGREERFLPLLGLSSLNRGWILSGLAYGGHDELVAKYAEVANVEDINGVLFGYAAAANDEAVGVWRARGGQPNFIIRGYAFGGHSERGFIGPQDNDVSRARIFLQYARGGWVEVIEAAIFAGEVSKLSIAGIYAAAGYHARAHHHISTYERSALTGCYAAAGDTDKVNQGMMFEGNPRFAIAGYKVASDNMYADWIRHALVFVEDEQLQAGLWAECEEHSIVPLPDLLTDARAIRMMRQKYRVNYHDAFSMSHEDRNWILKNGESIAVWLLQVQQKLFSQGVNYDAICHISSFVLGVSNGAAHRVYHAVANRIYQNTKRLIDYKYRDSWHACLLGKRLCYDKIHAAKKVELQNIGPRDFLVKP